MGSFCAERWISVAITFLYSAWLLVACPYTSIFSFGDSLADTGNLILTQPSDHCFSPPYGQTYFHHVSGRCSDGRLIIDFIAESLRFPLMKPYLEMKKSGEEWSVEGGVNFAVSGAMALDSSFFQKRGVYVKTNYSLTYQFNWFQESLPAICNSSTNCDEVIRNSLFIMGEIGGNDFNHALLNGKIIEEVKTYVPYVINAIASAVQELIGLGARTLMVPGNLPVGCNVMYLTYYETMDKNQYDQYGCLKWLNKFAEDFNLKLQNELHRIQGLYPLANIIYADYYNAALQLYHDPAKFGFIGLQNCCGMGGSYNYNSSVPCGTPGVRACGDPSQYIAWDGKHLTEAAYRLIAEGLINGPYSLPHFNTLCSMDVSSGYFIS